MKWFKQLLSVLLIGCLMACTFPFASTAARTPQEQKAEFQGHFYQIFSGICETWEEAQAYCESVGGHLATITSEEENGFLYRFLVESGYESAYFGLSDHVIEGEWVWVTGETVDYINWHPGEPNKENSNEDYGMFYYKFSDGSWNDGDFGVRTNNSGRVFLCEWDGTATDPVPNDPDNEVTDDIAQDELKTLYTNQHIQYYADEFEDEIQEIVLPSEASDNRRNTNNLLGNIVLDAAEDDVSTNYNVASVITDALNLKVNFGDEIVSNYEMILADIVTSSYYKDTLEEAFSVSFKDDVIQFLKDISDRGFIHLEDMAKNTGESVETVRREWQTLAQSLDRLNVCDNPDDFADIFGECSILVDKYMKASEKKSFLESIVGKKGYKGDALNAVLGASLDTVSEIITYYSCYEAYCTASDTFKSILVMIASNADRVVGNTNDPGYTGFEDELFYSESLRAAIKNFIANANDEATGAEQIASRFAKEGIENLGSSFAEAGVDILLGKIPIVKELNEARKILGITAAGTMLLVDVLTEIDDRAYAASMIYQLYFLANYSAGAARDVGDMLSRQEDPDQAFEWAYRFDEAVRIWRCCSLMLCDFGVKFETYCLQAAQKQLRPWPNSAIEEANWHSTAISIASLEKALISDIHCHDVNLSYDPSSGVINFGQNAQVITIACPVTVSVTDEKGVRIALLSDNYLTVEKGYEPYFHVLETERGSGEYMKICYLPDTWNVTFKGTGNGTMHVLKADVVNGDIVNPKGSPEIIISDDIEGYITHDDSEKIVVITNNGDFSFADVSSSDWFYEKVQYVYENNIMAGVSDTKFDPYATLDRAQAVQILYNLEGQPLVTGSASFSDVAGHWAIQAIMWASREGIAVGDGDGTFRPNDFITREEFAQMLYNYSRYKGYDISANGNLTKFRDASKISPWAEAALKWANGHGLINGHDDGTIDPQGPAQRCQAASILCQYNQVIEKN